MSTCPSWPALPERRSPISSERRLDSYLAAPEDESAQLLAFRAAVREAAGTVRRLPSGRLYVEELRRADAQRAQDIEGRSWP